MDKDSKKEIMLDRMREKKKNDRPVNIFAAPSPLASR